jgi:hypothetical protein
MDMLGMRRLVGFLIAIALAALALPAVADSGDYYRINMPAAAATGVQFNVTITNRAGFDNLKSFTITAPAGVYVTAVASGSANIPSNKITAPSPATAGGTISVSGISISNNQSGTLKITAAFPASCTAQTLAWTSSAKGGWIVNNEVFALDAANSNLKTTIAGGACTFSLAGDTSVAAGSAAAVVTMTLTNNAPATGSAITAITLTPPLGVTIVSPAGGIVTGLNVAGGTSAPISLTVSTLPSCTGAAAASWAVTSVTPSTLTQTGASPMTTITPPVPACATSITTPTSAAVNTDFSVTVGLTSGPGGANVTLTSTCGFTGAATTAASGYSAVFTGKVASQGTCTFNATADKGYPAATAVTGFKVFAVGSLSCGDPTNPTAANTIIGSASPTLTINDPGFAEGVRGQNIDKAGLPSCVPVNWTFTNNVLGTGTTPDAKGNPVPANGVSFVWDQAAQPNAAYSYTVTWQPEWFGLASAVNRKTQFCADAAPNACNIIVNAQACLSPALLPSSIPGTDPACVSAEVWAVVGSGLCTGAPGAGQNACVIFTTTITDIKDPPIIRN